MESSLVSHLKVPDLRFGWGRIGSGELEVELGYVTTEDPCPRLNRVRVGSSNTDHFYRKVVTPRPSDGSDMDLLLDNHKNRQPKIKFAEGLPLIELPVRPSRPETEVPRKGSADAIRPRLRPASLSYISEEFSDTLSSKKERCTGRPKTQAPRKGSADMLPSPRRPSNASERISSILGDSLNLDAFFEASTDLVTDDTMTSSVNLCDSKSRLDPSDEYAISLLVSSESSMEKRRGARPPVHSAPANNSNRQREFYGRALSAPSLARLQSMRSFLLSAEFVYHQDLIGEKQNYRCYIYSPDNNIRLDGEVSWNNYTVQVRINTSMEEYNGCLRFSLDEITDVEYLERCLVEEGFGRKGSLNEGKVVARVDVSSMPVPVLLYFTDYDKAFECVTELRIMAKSKNVSQSTRIPPYKEEKDHFIRENKCPRILCLRRRNK